VGQIVEQARQLVSWAQTGHVLVSPEIQMHTRQEFAFQPVEAAQELYRLDGEQPTIGALAARYLRTDRPVINREDALDAIASSIEAVKDGKGQVLVLSGPAGAGKRRLTEATVMRWLNAGGNGYGTIIRSTDTYTPLKPWIAVWRSIFGLANSRGALTLHDKFLAQIRGTCQAPDRAAGLMGPLVGVDIMPSKGLATLDARAWREGLFEVCVDLITGLAGRQPMIFVFENLHLADASTLALFEYLAPAIAGHPVLLCLTTESVSPQLGFYNLPHTVHANLSPLTGAEAWAFAKQLAPAIDWPPHIHTQLEALWGAASSDEPRCSPLLVEETLHLLAQAELLEYGNGGYHLANAGVTVDIPGTLDALLEARIEQLDAPAQTLLQTAAALGIVFEQSTLEAIYPGSMPGTALRDWLNTLIAARLIVMDEDSDPIARQLRFRHACIRSAALARLATDRLRTILVRLADYLVVQRELGTIEVDDAALAHYYTQGDVHDKAVDCALRAAIDSQQLYANAEALYHYQIAKRHVDALPDTASQWPLYLQIYLNQADIYLEMEDFASAEANASRAFQLAAEHRAHRMQAQATNLLGKVALRRGRGEDAVRFASEAIRLSEAANFQVELVVARRLQGRAYLQLGRPAEAWEPLWLGVELARKLGDPIMIAKTVSTLGVMYARNYRMMDAVLSLNEALDLIRPSGDHIRLADNLNHLGSVYLRRGEGDKALEIYEEAVATYRQIDRPLHLGSALQGLGAALCFTGRYQQAKQCFDEAAGLFGQHNAQFLLMACVGARARELERDLGQYATAQTHLEAALQVLAEAGGSFDTIVELRLALADVYVKLGRLSDAEEVLRAARAQIEGEKARWFWPEYHLAAGNLALVQGDHRAALDSTHQGLAAISGRGDPRLLSKIYLLLSHALRAIKPKDEPPICDALERSMLASRSRARRLDRALALSEFGSYLQTQASGKFTSRARGSGFLYEAEFIFKEIGIQRQGTNGSSTP
jgi:tetratricopeptide (TPR) repeat protein